MLFSARSKVGGLLSLLGIVTIISAFVFNGMLFMELPLVLQVGKLTASRKAF
jgi:hypothetical protein